LKGQNGDVGPKQTYTGIWDIDLGVDLCYTGHQEIWSLVMSSSACRPPLRTDAVG